MAPILNSSLPLQQLILNQKPLLCTLLVCGEVVERVLGRPREPGWRDLWEGAGQGFDTLATNTVILAADSRSALLTEDY